MAQYTIDFSTNALKVTQELDAVIAKIANVKKAGTKVTINLDTANFNKAIASTFQDLDRELSKLDRKLRQAPIGGPVFTSTQRQIGEVQGTEQRGRMAGEAIRLGAQAQAFDIGSLARYERELRSLQIQASLIAPNTKEWVELQRNIGIVNTDLRKTRNAAEAIQIKASLGAFAPGSLNRMEGQLRLLQIRAEGIKPDTREWKTLNKEIQKLEQGIERVRRKPLTPGQRAGAAGGAFLYGGGLGGGVGSAVGGIAGGLAGGVPGAFAGAAIGQAADNIGTAIAGVTRQAASVEQLRRGLAMASIDAQDFAMAQETIADISQRVLMPLEQTTRLYTQLRINTKEYGLSVKDTAEILEGTALALSAAGGSAEDLDGAMRAVVQILSKGRVQAEELRGQLGDRFPGAVLRFAQANKLSFEELQVGLQRGTIGIEEFINFAKSNYEDYAKFSEQLATAPEFAGRRLAVAFEQMQVAIGSTMGVSGASIQDSLSEWIRYITEFVKENKGTLTQMAKDFADVFGVLVEIVRTTTGIIGGLLYKIAEFFQNVTARIRMALDMANVADYALQIQQVDKEIERAEAKSDGRAAQRLIRLKKRRAELEEAFKARGGQAALDAQGLEFSGPGGGMATGREETDTRDLERQAQAYLDAVERREESLAKSREQYEDDIAQARINAIKQAEDLERRYQDARLQAERQLARARRELQAATTEEGFLVRTLDAPLTGERESVIEAEQRAGEIIRQYTEERITREEEAQDRQLQLARDLEAFKKTNADAINEAGERYARRNGEIQRSYAQAVARIISDGTGEGARKLEAAGRVTAALLRQATAAQAIFSTMKVGVTVPFGPTDTIGYGNLSFTPGAFLEAAGRSGNPFLESAAQELVQATAEVRAGRQQLSTPSRAGVGVSAAFVPSVSTADLDARVQVSSNALSVTQGQVDDVNNALSRQSGIVNAMLKQFTEQNSAITAQNINLREQEDILTRQLALVRDGMVPELAREKAERQAMFDLARVQAAASKKGALEEAASIKNAEERRQVEEDINKRYDARIDRLNEIEAKSEGQLVLLKENEARLEAARILQERNILGQGLRAGYSGDAARVFEDALRRGDPEFEASLIADATRQMQLFRVQAEETDNILNSIGDSFGQVFKGMISGTASAQETLAGFFRSIADSFTNMVGRMIAEWAKIQIAQNAPNLFSALRGATSPLSAAATGAGAADAAVPSAATMQWPALQPLPPIPQAEALPVLPFSQRLSTGAFAKGGIITGPTLSLMGEGRYNEAVVPLPDGRSIPVELGGGASNVQSSIVINIDGNGNVQSSDSSNASDFGRRIEGAVKQVIVNELRPGGVLAGSRR